MGKQKKKALENSGRVLNDRAVDKNRKPKGKATAKATKVLNRIADDVEPEDPAEVDNFMSTKKIGLPGKADGSNRKDWAVKPLTDAKSQYMDGREDWWGKGALHHLVSKEKLTTIGEQLAKACHGSGGPALRTAALDFWYLCCQLAGEHICEAVRQGSASDAINPVRLLWNMPIMVSLGPPSPANDPGQNFDADTEPVPGGNGERQLTEASEHLLKLEKIWDAADIGLGNYDVTMWQGMHTCLLAAHKVSKKRGRGRRLLYPPLPEQWLNDSYTHQVIKQGLVKFLGTKDGIERFRGARFPEGGALSNTDAAVFLEDTLILGADAKKYNLERTCTIVLDGAKAELIVQVSTKTLQHICRRHTLTFFDFGGTERPVNTLWPNVTSFVKMHHMVDVELMPAVVEGCTRALRFVDTEDMHQSTEVDVAHVPNPPWGTLYMKINISKFPDENVVTVKVKTIAPDGEQALGFLRADLNAMKAHFRPYHVKKR
ncbi:hypothetical protein [Catenulispora yoronensis]|uniref:hypothetical protein n=1 Tax=Catenulispora yoronensis TaxID=450799 RepID=UPI0031D2CCCB